MTATKEQERKTLEKIDLSKLMKDLYNLGYKRPEVEAIFLAVHGSEDNGHIYDAQ